MSTSLRNFKQSQFNLIITDNEPLAVEVCKVLSRLGHSSPSDKVVFLEQGAQIAQASANNVRWILMALRTSADQGLAIVRQIRQFTSIPIFVIGPRDVGLVLDAIHAGVND